MHRFETQKNLRFLSNVERKCRFPETSLCIACIRSSGNKPVSIVAEDQFII